MKDRNGNEIKEGDPVRCGTLTFIIESFQTMRSGEILARGRYGSINTDYLVKEANENKRTR